MKRPLAFLHGLALVSLWALPALAQQTQQGFTSPGGSTTQLQYNNAGAFGGTSGITTDGARVIFGAFGTKTAPNVTVNTGTNAGWYSRSGTILDLSNLTNEYYSLQTGAFLISSGASVAWSSGFPDIAGGDTGLSRCAAAVICAGTGAQGTTGGTFQGGLKLTNLAISNTAATISAAGGLGTSPSITANGSAVMDITAGSSTSAATFTIGLPTAANGWVCNGSDITTNSATVFIIKQSGGSATTAVMGVYSDAAVLSAPVAADHIRLQCLAY